MKVLKRNGSLEEVDYEKIHKVINWASEGLNNVSVSEVEMNASLQMFDGISTDDIHTLLVKSAANLISKENPDYQKLSARLLSFSIRKIVYGEYAPTHIYEHVKNKTKLNKYDSQIFDSYSEEEFNLMDLSIRHERDDNFSYAGIKQFEQKYLLQNRVTKQKFESPQMAYMLIAATFFINYPKDIRMSYVIRFYDAISLFKISLPTPIMSGLRTPIRQFSSCVLIEADDSLDSISATSSAIVKYVSQKAGIGVNIGRIRGAGSSIRNGDAEHTGIIPFIKHFQTAVKSCSQGGVRGGAATVFYPIWHYEVMDLIVLKNNKGVEENRARHLDYGIQINEFFYKRLQSNGVISLFSTYDVPGLYDAFFADQVEFERLYLQYELDSSIRRKSIQAIELFTQIAMERNQTGRIYIQNVDHCNTHSAFDPSKAPIKQSNLCMEITLPTQSFEDVYGEKGEIALCTLSAINLGEIESDEEMESIIDLMVRALDELLTYQDYPVKCAELSTNKRRSLGIGVTNYAYFLAKNGCKYSDGSANQLTHELFESIQFYALKSSCNLAKEKGACEAFSDTNYSKGILPIDTYRRTVDQVAEPTYKKDWEWLRAEILANGLRNSTLTALMPCETSSQITNSTNGIEPPRNLVSVKMSKDGMMKQVVPGIEKYADQYETLWQIKRNKEYLDLIAIMQKFVDQSISANTNYDPKNFEDDKVPVKVILNDIFYAYKMGAKTLYYSNTRDHAASSYSEEKEDDGCAGGACKL
jgi:ribonucleoside-diphosphate reductase alpha chain